MDPIASPHDAFFRESFGRREIAQDFLRHQLPAGLLAALDLETLEVSKDTYVGADLRSAYAGLVSTPCSTGPSASSRPTAWMPCCTETANCSV